MFVMMTLSPDTMPLSAKFYSGELFFICANFSNRDVSYCEVFLGKAISGYMLSSRTLFKSKANRS